MASSTDISPAADGSSPTIRRIEADEGPLLRDIRIRALTDSPEAFGASLEETQARPDSHWDERAGAGASGWDSAIFLATDETGRGVGVVMGYSAPEAAGVISLVSMWTDPEARGQGLAGRLIDVLLEWADASAIELVELWVMRDNTKAARLYEHKGFSVADDPRTDPGDACRDEICMQRSR